MRESISLVVRSVLTRSGRIDAGVEVRGVAIDVTYTFPDGCGVLGLPFVGEVDPS
jgi:hypothetical protein